MNKIGRFISILWKFAGILLLIVLLGYLLFAFLLPAPKEPQPISLSGCKFENIFEPFDGQFVAIYVTKNPSNEESLKYLKDWETLNAGFDRRDLTEIVGFDKRRNSISKIRCLLLIDCRNGKYHRSNEEHFDKDGRLMHYISSKERQSNWNQISEDSTIDQLAIQYCGKSVY